MWGGIMSFIPSEGFVHIEKHSGVEVTETGIEMESEAKENNINPETLKVKVLSSGTKQYKPNDILLANFIGLKKVDIDSFIISTEHVLGRFQQ